MAFLSAVGSIISGVIGFAQASYQASVAKMNAEVAQDNAKRAIERSQVNEQEQDAANLAFFGDQEAAQSASGINVNSDSARRVRRTSRILSRKDVLNIRQDAEIEKYNNLVQAENFKAEANMAKIGGLGSLLGGFIQAGGSLVGRSSATASPFTPKPVRRPSLLT